MARKPRIRARPRPDGNARPLAPMRPDASVQDPLPLRELPSGPEDAARMGLPELTYLRRWILGECSLILTRTDQYGYHLSIAHPSRYPTWDEIAQARYRLLPADRWFAMYLPPPEEYVNLHRNCFQLHECPEPSP